MSETVPRAGKLTESDLDAAIRWSWPQRRASIQDEGPETMAVWRDTEPDDATKNYESEAGREYRGGMQMLAALMLAVACAVLGYGVLPWLLRMWAHYADALLTLVGAA